MKIIYDFFRLWIKWGDRKEAWEDAKLINNKDFIKDIKNYDINLYNKKIKNKNGKKN